MNRKDITIIILVLIILIVVGYYGYNYLYDKAYQDGAIDGVAFIVQTQTTNSEIYLYGAGGNVTQIPLNQLCGGAG